MGLNIGVRVRRHTSYGYNPEGKNAELEEQFDAFLREKFPGVAFKPSATLQSDWKMYEFDVRLDYAWNNYDNTPMYLAILEFVLSNFSVDYEIECHIYHSP